MSDMSHPMPFRAALLLGLAASAPFAASAATLSLVASDAVDTSSFASGLNWPGGAAPSAGNHYVVGPGLRIRTPIGSGSHGFAGASLTIRNGFNPLFPDAVDSLLGLTYKGAGSGGIITIPDLILDGGAIDHLSSPADRFQLAGRLTVTSPSIIRAKQGPIILRAALAGSADLYIGATDGGSTRNVIFSANNSQGVVNTFTGDIVLTVASSFVILETGGNLAFAIGPAGVNNRIRGVGTLALRGAFHLDLSAAGQTYGDTWHLVAADTLTETYTSTFSIPGFADPEDDGTWISADGNYRFSEATGSLLCIGFRPDTDADGLPDEWEIIHFGDLGQTASGDPDADGRSNLQEFVAGSDPTLANPPDDTDFDGLSNAWELGHFGNLSQTAAADPDADGETNLAEYAAGSAPNNRASTSADTDADGLPDAWEFSRFATLAHNAGADPDLDGFSNLQELLAATDPADPASRPAGTAARLVPVDDGDPSTSEFGYAGASSINAVSFIRSALQTVGDQQFMTWYGRHQYSATAAFNNTLWIGRRTLGSSQWEVFKHPSFTANDITDGHDVISFGIDGAGYLHLTWGMHGDALHYSRSTTPVTGSGPIALGPDTAMTGTERQVTYPQFLRLPDGDLLFLYRYITSGNGAQFLNRYSFADRAWRPVHTNPQGAAVPFISGIWAPLPDYNPYLNMPQLGGPDGRTLTLTWCWRYLPVNGPGAPGSPGGFNGYQTNNQLNFARSLDAGLTWQKFDGTPYGLPITRNAENGDQTGRAEVIQALPEGSSLINQAGMCLDAAGHPVTATWWAPEASTGNHRRQYMVHFRGDDATWQTRAVSSRALDSPAFDSPTDVRDLARPVVVCDDADRIIVAYRDNEGANGLTIVHSLPRAEDPDRLLWIRFDLTAENLGDYEPLIDHERWARDRQLHFLYQPSSGHGYTPPANTASRISVLEWDAAGYFNHSPQPRLETTDGGAGVRLHWRSEPSFTYRLWTSTDLINWTEVETRVGTGATFEHRHTFAPGEPKRFWRLERTEGAF